MSLAALAATLLGIAGVFLGLWLSTAGKRTRLVVPFSAGVLLGVVLFGLLPELVQEIGWLLTGLYFALGYALLFLVNRYLAPVCPTCAHDHDHQACQTALHGFAAPLIAASMLHSFFDGWSVTTAQMAGHAGIRLAVALAVGMHKIPEGIALGAIVRASVKSRAAALGWSLACECATLPGSAAALAIAPGHSTQWITYPLGVAGGWLFFLAAHAVHQEWKRRGPLPACMTALTGAAGAAVLQQGVEAWFR